MNINENIKNFRTFRGIKQQDLADLLGRSKSVISNWERGENSPDLDSCEKLCKILNVTPNQLFGWEKNLEYESYLNRLREYQQRLSKLELEREKLDKDIENLNNNLIKAEIDNKESLIKNAFEKVKEKKQWQMQDNFLQDPGRQEPRKS